MGLWEKLFGGTEQKQTQGTQPYLDAIGDYGASVGIGKDAELGKHIMAAFADGNYDSDGTISSFLNPVRDLYNTTIRDQIARNLRRTYGMAEPGDSGSSAPAKTPASSGNTAQDLV